MTAPARMPAIFFGHGSPMIALETNAVTQTLRKMALAIPRPKAILCASAHWMTRGTAVTGMEHLETIHDFRGLRRTCPWCSSAWMRRSRRPGTLRKVHG